MVGVTDAGATVVVEVSLSFLAVRASTVIVGVPGRAVAVWEVGASGRRRIVTYRLVLVERVVAGEVERREVWVRSLGGRIGDIAERVEGEAVLPAGRRMLLFLVENADGTASVLAMAQGAYVVARGEDGVDRLETMRERGMVAAAAGEPSAAARLSGRTLQESTRLVTEARVTHAP